MHPWRITPILNVSDLAASFAWFDRLGWSKRWDWGEPPTFGAVRAGDCEIFLCQDGQGGRGRTGHLRPRLRRGRRTRRLDVHMGR